MGLTELLPVTSIYNTGKEGDVPCLSMNPNTPRSLRVAAVAVRETPLVPAWPPLGFEGTLFRSSVPSGIVNQKIN